MTCLPTVLAAALALMISLTAASVAEARSSGTHYTYQGGHYAGGRGSSHRNGHYVNPRTHNHYTRH